MDDEDIKVNRDLTLDFSQSKWKVGTLDLNAVEAGMQLSERYGGDVSVLTAAGDVVEDSKMNKAILARGPEQKFAVYDKALDTADSLATAKALAAGIRHIGDVDVVICGEGSSDQYARQVGSMLGFLLGWNTMNAVSSIALEGGELVVERSLENGIEVIKAALPAVISVTGDINKPRIAGMKDILAAGKKPSTTFSAGDCGVSVENTSVIISTLAPAPADRRLNILEGESDDVLNEFCAELKKSW
jgi:electron transfer flavoprotein beta subunit